MKKIICFVLIAALCLSLCGCFGIESGASIENTSSARSRLEDASGELDSLYTYLQRAYKRGEISEDVYDEIVYSYLYDIESDIAYARKLLK